VALEEENGEGGGRAGGEDGGQACFADPAAWRRAGGGRGEGDERAPGGGGKFGRFRWGCGGGAGAGGPRQFLLHGGIDAGGGRVVHRQGLAHQIVGGAGRQKGWLAGQGAQEQRAQNLLPRRERRYRRRRGRGRRPAGLSCGPSSLVRAHLARRGARRIGGGDLLRHLP